MALLIPIVFTLGVWWLSTGLVLRAIQPSAGRQREALAGASLLLLLGMAGVVVTHGTDTLEETAYFLDLTVTSPKPVIIVGAQMAASYYDSDGRRNLLNAVRVAVSPEAVGKGAMVVMNGQIKGLELRLSI